MTARRQARHELRVRAYNRSVARSWIPTGSSESPDAANHAGRRAGSGIARVWRAWRVLTPDRRLAAAAALGLFATLFLPWYQETGLVSGKTLEATTLSLTGWAAFSWVEAAVLLVAVGVLSLLFLRAEERAFHLPGGDGVIVMAAGGWTCLLLVWRIFDKQGVSSHGQIATTAGIEWGIFTALGVAGTLTYAGSRIRAAHMPEPLLPGEARPNGREGSAGRPRRGAAAAGGADAAAARPSRNARRASWAEPISWDEPAGLVDRAVSVATPPGANAASHASEREDAGGAADGSEPEDAGGAADGREEPTLVQLRIPFDD